MDDRDPAHPDDETSGARPPPNPVGAEALRGSSPRALLHRLLDHDPFELQARSVGRLEQRALLLPERRVWLRALARVAHAGLGYRGSPPLDEWIAARIDKAIEEIQDEDLQAELANEPLQVPYEGRLLALSQGLGLEIGMTRRACIRFNGLPDRVRQTFFAVSILGRPVNRYVAEGNGPPEQVNADLRAALLALSAYAEADDLDLGELDDDLDLGGDEW